MDDTPAEASTSAAQPATATVRGVDIAGVRAILIVVGVAGSGKKVVNRCDFLSKRGRLGATRRQNFLPCYGLGGHVSANLRSRGFWQNSAATLHYQCECRR